MQSFENYRMHIFSKVDSNWIASTKLPANKPLSLWNCKSNYGLGTDVLAKYRLFLYCVEQFTKYLRNFRKNLECYLFLSRCAKSIWKCNNVFSKILEAEMLFFFCLEISTWYLLSIKLALKISYNDMHVGILQSTKQ